MHFHPTIFKHPNKLHHHYRTHTFVVEESSTCSNKWAGTKTKPNPQTKPGLLKKQKQQQPNTRDSSSNPRDHFT